MSWTNKDLLVALDAICQGRVVLGPGDLQNAFNPDVVSRTSHIPGKAVTELPGLIVGAVDRELGSIGLAMSMTENVIELAGAMGLDALVVHHPVADAASSGGVLIRDYLGLYDLSLFELHEAFHGTHPGAAYLHGFEATTIHTGYRGNPGVNVYVGDTLAGVDRVRDLLARQREFLSSEVEDRMLAAERKIRDDPKLEETLVSTAPELLAGDPESPVTRVAQFAPHSGFNARLLELLLEEDPQIDTLIAAKGRLRPANPIVQKGRELGLSVLNGNSHGLEIYENWMPLTAALRRMLPGLETYVIRERVVASRFEDTGSEALREYANLMAARHLTTKPRRQVDVFTHEADDRRPGG